jgi:hypothetical protein
MMEFESEQPQRSGTASDSKQDVETYLEKLEQLQAQSGLDLADAEDEIQVYLSKRSNIQSVVEEDEKEAKKELGHVDSQLQEYKKQDYYEEQWVPKPIFRNTYGTVDLLRSVNTWRTLESKIQHTLIEMLYQLLGELEGRRISTEFLEEARQMVKDLEKKKLDTFEELMKDRIGTVESDLSDRLDRLEQDRELFVAVSQQLSTLTETLQELEVDDEVADAVTDAVIEELPAAVVEKLDETGAPVDSPAAQQPGTGGVDVSGSVGGTGGGSERSETATSQPQPDPRTDTADMPGIREDLDDRSLCVLQLLNDGANTRRDLADRLDVGVWKIKEKHYPALKSHDLIESGHDGTSLTDKGQRFLQHCDSLPSVDTVPDDTTTEYICEDCGADYDSQTEFASHRSRCPER